MAQQRSKKPWTVIAFEAKVWPSRISGSHSLIDIVECS